MAPLQMSYIKLQYLERNVFYARRIYIFLFYATFRKTVIARESNSYLS